MASEGAVVLSYENTSLRESDVALLGERQWLNDNIIAFWYDYLEHEVYKDHSECIAFISPQVVHFIKCGQAEDVRTVVHPLELLKRKLIFLPINDSTAQSTSGGTHWSLLIFKAASKTFEHYDSHTGSVNRLQAENVSKVLLPFLFGKDHLPEEPIVYEMECTQQVNGYDCGIHVICNTEALCRIKFKNDNRHISDMVTPLIVSQARRDLRNLISSLKVNV